jgi:hypothetical protein
MKSPLIKLFGALLVTLIGANAAQAGPVYRWVGSSSGDTVNFAGMADNGNLLLNGFGDVCLGGKSAIRQYDSALGDYGGRQYVSGLPNGLDSLECGVQVARLNSAGDLVGTSLRGGVSIPTFWRGGVAFDLRDPANIGLIFTPDPFAVAAIGVDLSTLDIIAPDAGIRFGTDFYLRSLWTNALGMYGAESTRFNNKGYVLIPVAAAVSEPGTVLLVMGAVAALMAGRRSALVKNRK